MITWSPLDGGLLGRNALKKMPGSRSDKIGDKINAQRAQLEQFGQLSEELRRNTGDRLPWLGSLLILLLQRQLSGRVRLNNLKVRYVYWKSI